MTNPQNAYAALIVFNLCLSKLSSFFVCLTQTLNLGHFAFCSLLTKRSQSYPVHELAVTKAANSFP